MGQIDDYLVSQVTPLLLAGEQIMGMGVLRHPLGYNAIGVPTRYEEWLAVATNHRLMLMKTENSGLFNVLTVKPKLVNLESRVWWYQELKGVGTGTVNGIGNGVSLGLEPHVPLGPYEGKTRCYDMFPQVEGLDAHAQFYAQFGTWLKQQVAAGAFPMDEQRKAVIAAHEEKLRQEAERKGLAAEERKRKAKRFFAAWRSWLPPTIMTLLFFTAVGFGIAAADYFGSASRASDDAAEVDKEIAAEKACLKATPKSDRCSDRTLKNLTSRHADRLERRDDQMLWGGIMIGITLLFLAASGGTGVVWIVLRSKARKAAAALPQAA